MVGELKEVENRQDEETRPESELHYSLSEDATRDHDVRLGADAV